MAFCISEEVCTNLLKLLSSPYFETKHKPNAQLDTPCNTSPSCSDNGVLPPNFSVQNGGNTTQFTLGYRGR